MQLKIHAKFADIDFGKAIYLGPLCANQIVGVKHYEWMVILQFKWPIMCYLEKEFVWKEDVNNHILLRKNTNLSGDRSHGGFK